ncbi:MAG: hypothetical protein H7A46_01775 [Verrucomicrobiales bacterium]|nr:hypothetical protein [Verrucomicrobiales bacterium]
MKLNPKHIAAAALTLACLPMLRAADSPFPGPRGEKLDLAAREDIWSTDSKGFLREFVKVPRDEVVAFAVYTHDHGVLKMSAQLYPLMPDEPREVRLELRRNGAWQGVAQAPVVYPGWYAHFRLENWDNTQDVRYRVRHGEKAMFEGLIRKDPVDKDVIVVGSLSCDSNADRGDRDSIVNNLKKQDPDLLFFAGDQSYDHTEHTAAWLLWGHQFRDVIKDRPVVTIPDDHDIGQGNVWGENGIVADSSAGDSGGYYYPPEYIRMVFTAQTWHLPDPTDPTPCEQNIPVYFTRLRVGGVDFAVLSDRQFKSGPRGKIPQMGPRPDHIRQPGYDPKQVDLPELRLLGDRQLAFLNEWGQDWTGTRMKAVLSQTAFCGAVHLHGSTENRLLADLDCNGWPQTGRNKALAAIRRALACHLCGDQHLTVVVQHGIDAFRDGPYAFTNPAMINSYYGRWWWPEDEQPGAHPVPGSPLPWTGDYLDGLYNRITMIAYANPAFDKIGEMKQNQRNPEALLGDGYGLVKFNKRTRQTTFECWPRYADLADGDAAQYPGWPITFRMEENDGREVFGYLPEVRIEGQSDAVVQVVSEADGEILYTGRIVGDAFRPKVFAPGKYTVKVGRDKPDGWSAGGLEPGKRAATSLRARL